MNNRSLSLHSHQQFILERYVGQYTNIWSFIGEIQISCPNLLGPSKRKLLTFSRNLFPSVPWKTDGQYECGKIGLSQPISCFSWQSLSYVSPSHPLPFSLLHAQLDFELTEKKRNEKKNLNSMLIPLSEKKPKQNRSFNSITRSNSRHSTKNLLEVL